LRQKIEGDYAALTLDLERALAKQDKKRALSATRAILPLLSHLPESGYVAELRRIERRLQLRENGSDK
jgi:hypothetical protein